VGRLSLSAFAHYGLGLLFLALQRIRLNLLRQEDLRTPPIVWPASIMPDYFQKKLD
jgi:hypothetical protein